MTTDDEGGVEWNEPTSIARFQAGGLVFYTGPLSLVLYHKRFAADDPSVQEHLLCPAVPIGKALEVDPRGGLWRHVPIPTKEDVMDDREKTTTTEDARPDGEPEARTPDDARVRGQHSPGRGESKDQGVAERGETK